MSRRASTSRPGRPSPRRRGRGGAAAVGLGLVAAALACGGPSAGGAQESAGAPEAAAGRWGEVVAGDSGFARLVRRLSGPGAYFDTDNLISNERSYLHVIGDLRETGFRGGAYLGVGPDQNFSYIAAVRPRVAFIVDVRRDNLLLHLLFKALFEQSSTRLDYLSGLLGRAPPGREVRRVSEGWEIAELVDRVDRTAEDGRAARAAVVAALERIRGYGLALSPADLETIERFHRTFIREGLGLRFRSHGRSPQFYYPTYRQLVLERDLEGRPASFLASEEAFRFVKGLSDRNRIIPVVGDLGGGDALPAIARLLEERGERISAFYVSNVEFYLMRQGTFGRFLDDLARLPRGPRSVLVRSYFGGAYGRPHPRAVPGYWSVQLLEPVAELLERASTRRMLDYRELVGGDAGDGRRRMDRR